MKILLISGHGAGDSGAVGNGYKEADLARQATSILEGKLKAYALTVTRYPVSQNAYADNKNGKAPAWKNYNLVVEVHFNSYNGSAYGTEVLYKPDNMKSLAAKISAAIASYGFLNRGAKYRSDLMNMNSCARLGVPYVLIETCFIDNKADMDRYSAHRDSIWYSVAKAICDYYGIKKNASNGGDAVKNGWYKTNGYWYYYDKGNMAKDKWVQDKGAWYYLRTDGKMATSQWAQDSNKKWYWLGSDGKMVKDKWIQYKGAWYWLKSNGMMASDEWIQDKGNWYYLKSDGKMATGTLSVKHTFNSSGKCTK